MTTEVEEVKEEVTEEVTEATNETPNLSVTDLVNIKQIIDVATQRSAFKPEEYEVIGATYKRLVAFLAAVTENSKENTDTQAEETTPETEEKE